MKNYSSIIWGVVLIEVGFSFDSDSSETTEQLTDLSVANALYADLGGAGVVRMERKDC